MQLVLNSFQKKAISCTTKIKKRPPNSPQMPPEPSSSDNRTDSLHAVMEPAGGLAVSAHTEAVLRAGRTSLGVRLSD